MNATHPPSRDLGTSKDVLERAAIAYCRDRLPHQGQGSRGATTGAGSGAGAGAGGGTDSKYDAAEEVSLRAALTVTAHSLTCIHTQLGPLNASEFQEVISAPGKTESAEFCGAAFGILHAMLHGASSSAATNGAESGAGNTGGSSSSSGTGDSR